MDGILVAAAGEAPSPKTALPGDPGLQRNSMAVAWRTGKARLVQQVGSKGSVMT